MQFVQTSKRGVEPFTRRPRSAMHKAMPLAGTTRPDGKIVEDWQPRAERRRVARAYVKGHTDRAPAWLMAFGVAKPRGPGKRETGRWLGRSLS